MTNHIEEARKIANEWTTPEHFTDLSEEIAAAIAAAEERGRMEERAKIDQERGYIEDENGNKGWIVP